MFFILCKSFCNFCCPDKNKKDNNQNIPNNNSNNINNSPQNGNIDTRSRTDLLIIIIISSIIYFCLGIYGITRFYSSSVDFKSMDNFSKNYGILNI